MPSALWPGLGQDALGRHSWPAKGGAALRSHLTQLPCQMLPPPPQITHGPSPTI